SDVLSACVYMADLPKYSLGFDIYQKLSTVKYYCNMIKPRQTAVPVPDPASATARFRCWRGRQAIVPTLEAARDRFRRRVFGPPGRASPVATAASAAAGRAAPRGGNGGSAGSAR